MIKKMILLGGMLIIQGSVRAAAAPDTNAIKAKLTPIIKGLQNATYPQTPDFLSKELLNNYDTNQKDLVIKAAIAGIMEHIGSINEIISIINTGDQDNIVKAVKEKYTVKGSGSVPAGKILKALQDKDPSLQGTLLTLFNSGL